MIADVALAMIGPVGVPSSCCTTPVGHTRLWVDRRPTRRIIKLRRHRLRGMPRRRCRSPHWRR